MGLGGCSTGGGSSLAHNGLRAKVSGNNFVLCHREADLYTMYRCVEDGSIRQVPWVVGPRTRPQIGGEGDS